MRKVLDAEFFRRPADKVARDLLGKHLLRRKGTEEIRATLAETEAYLGVHDLASHSAKGRTRRTEVMFGPPGRLYVYRIYGLHWMLNVVTGDEGDAAAVLIRGVVGVSGPGRVAAALDVTGALHGLEASSETGLWFEDAIAPAARRRITVTARIGVEYAGPIWAEKKLRFVLNDR